MKKLIEEELLKRVGGGYNVDDLTPEELAELEKYGGMLVELQINAKNGQPYNKEEVMSVLAKIDQLDKTYKAKYGA